MLQVLLLLSCILLPSMLIAGELTANSLHRESSGSVSAIGEVRLQSDQLDIKADQMTVDLDSMAGDIYGATVQFKQGYTLRADHLKRIDLENFQGESVDFTMCPEDDRAWVIYADEATLNREEGVFRAKNAWFEWGGVPLLYTPRWEHALTRRTGLLMPKFGQSEQRGTEFILPFYWAAAPNWDMTFSPHWMSKRGVMHDIEWRHRSASGAETIQIRSIDDQFSATKRNRLLTDMAWSPTPTIQASLKIDAVDDGLHVADFTMPDEKSSQTYLTSVGIVSWQEQRDRVSLSSRYQQRLGVASNASTLQVMPRLDSHHYFDVSDSQIMHVVHETTQFQRDVGFKGLRTAVKPEWIVPWEMEEGGISTEWSLMGQFVGYDSKGFSSATASYAAIATSLKIQTVFERVFADKQWRHEIKPIIRLDASSAPNQSELPRYDSSLAPLSISNIMRGNRYSGWDRFERMQRASFLLESTLQNKSELQTVDTVLLARVGMVWDALQESVDENITLAPTRVSSNVLAEISWSPFSNATFTVGGQNNPELHKWVESHAGMQWSSSAHALSVSWQKIDSSYAADAESLLASAHLNFDTRWSSYASTRYDRLRKQSLENMAGISYVHPCWDVSFEGFESFVVGSDGVMDRGLRLLLAFEGLGSFGGS